MWNRRGSEAMHPVRHRQHRLRRVNVTRCCIWEGDCSDILLRTVKTQARHLNRFPGLTFHGGDNGGVLGPQKLDDLPLLIELTRPPISFFAQR